MFCSASDQGANSKGSCFPGDWNNCIRIGAASFTGDKLPWVDDRVDFWFPGRSVPFTSQDDKSVVYESGSSVATAAASGLAGVLIYSAMLLKTRACKEIVFQSRYKMMRAFTAMAKGTDGKFPRTDEGLNKIFKQKIRQLRTKNQSNTIDIEELQWTDETAEALEILLNHLQE
ncbi:hypothetical protein EAF00_000316 [Botryotinia globosa]|nr:hypothetical protein EAF00_000316 [Botryotinia globosa]